MNDLNYSYQAVRQRGFALVVALSLMAFVLLLVISLSTLVRVNYISAVNQKDLTSARQNALLGLQIALGELQKTLGPDQRISTTAVALDTITDNDNDDYDSEAGTLSTDGVNSKRQHWTGVWDVDTDAAGYPTTAFHKWLVSGYPAAHISAIDDAMEASPNFSDPVDLVAGPQPVEAGKVKFDTASGSEGGYAYWIGDEGVKAKVNIRSSALSADPQSAQHFGLSAMTGLDWLPLDPSGETAKWFSAPTLKIIAQNNGVGSAQSVDRRFHDLTYDGFGLLVDTLDGGLKKDLTTALYETPDQPEGLIFEPVSGTISIADPGGPTWEQLRSWVALQPDNSGELPVQPSSATQVGAYPVLTGFQLYWIPTYDPDSGAIRMNILPAISLWNPYDVPLASADYFVTFGRTNMDLSGAFSNFTNLWYTWQLEAAAAVAQMITSAPAIFKLPSVSLAPGESIVFSASGLSAGSFSNSSEIGSLSPGFRPSEGFYYDTGLAYGPVAKANNIYNYSYSAGINNTRTHSLRLSTGANVADAITLQTIVYMNDNPTSQRFNFSTLSMDANDAIVPDLSDAIGVKILHAFVDNDSTAWASSANKLLPETRKWLAQNNPRAALHGPSPLTFGEAQGWYSAAVTMNPSYICSLHKGGDYVGVGFTDVSGNRVAVGYREESGIEHTVLFQNAPERGQLHSIGQLMHAPLYNNGTGNLDTFLETSVYHSRFGNLIPTYTIGNSDADPAIPLSSLEVDWGNAYTIQGSEARFFSFIGIHHDYSYKLNLSLWNRYFFSTIDEEGKPGNSRIIRLEDDGSVVQADIDSIAANLGVNGAFNVNSTSVEAWRALLASFYGARVVNADGTASLEPNPSEPASPLLRLDAPMGDLFDTSSDDAKDAVAYNGYRALTSIEIEALAAAIVEQVKERGPFGSLAQFVNRMPNSSEQSQQLKGTISAAIAATDINESLRDSAFEAQPTGISAYVAAAEEGWRTENLPGWLSQADVLARLGSVLSTRSDTFLIRAYGEVVHPLTGAVTRARCEAVVQRLPEYVVSQGNAPEDTVDDLTELNAAYGRRFVVVKFRWMEDNEV